jgi:hypothetical protein
MGEVDENENKPRAGERQAGPNEVDKKWRMRGLMNRVMPGGRSYSNRC